jgi:hypothetical protein
VLLFQVPTTTFMRDMRTLLQIRQFTQLRSTTCSLQGLSSMQRSAQATPSRDLTVGVMQLGTLRLKCTKCLALRLKIRSSAADHSHTHTTTQKACHLKLVQYSNFGQKSDGQMYLQNTTCSWTTLIRSSFFFFDMWLVGAPSCC